MRISLRLPAVLLIATFAAAAASARADDRAALLQVNAELIVTCRFEASVPRVGAPNRDRGAASFSLSCQKGVAATTCDGACEPPSARSAQARHGEWLAENRDDGTTLATLLF